MKKVILLTFIFLLIIACTNVGSGNEERLSRGIENEIQVEFVDSGSHYRIKE
ncbi:hypothetical protein PM10SUCC1_16080 [Propionigenium maris DSM 9537]|uniref:Lipoprotein n=1 Tax=Propionigenium maris DSM 9537 TaxID=1123000 RepID=A0A9W6GJ30_9FUSO|nr:hypothetical protein [Propionigenium maris]GLI56094.1 hypothetical protein PM10SUCC1_16080 [Propionigenium maris DSM 9537]